MSIMIFEKMTARDGGMVARLTQLDAPIRDSGDFLDVLATGASETLVLQDVHLAPAFFDLKSGVLGEVLQKVSNYRARLVILGDFSDIESTALRQFIGESNRGGRVVFADDLENGLAALR